MPQNSVYMKTRDLQGEIHRKRCSRHALWMDQASAEFLRVHGFLRILAFSELIAERCKVFAVLIA
jgi:hypothetical protein